MGAIFRVSCYTQFRAQVPPPRWTRVGFRVWVQGLDSNNPVELQSIFPDNPI